MKFNTWKAIENKDSGKWKFIHSKIEEEDDDVLDGFMSRDGAGNITIYYDRNEEWRKDDFKFELKKQIKTQIESDISINQARLERLEWSD